MIRVPPDAGSVGRAAEGGWLAVKANQGCTFGPCVKG